MSGASWSGHDTRSRGDQDAGLVLILLALTVFAIWWIGSSVDGLASMAEQERLNWCQAHPTEVEVWRPFDDDPCLRAWEER